MLLQELQSQNTLNVKGQFGYTQLHEICYLGDEQICRLLLSRGQNVDSLSRNGSTPLLVQAREGHEKIVKLLLSYKQHPDDGGDKGWSVLYIQAGEGNIPIIELLLQYGQNQQEPSADNRLPYHEQLDHGHGEQQMLLARVTPSGLHQCVDNSGEQQQHAHEQGRDLNDSGVHNIAHPKGIQKVACLHLEVLKYNTIQNRRLY